MRIMKWIGLGLLAVLVLLLLGTGGVVGWLRTGAGEAWLTAELNGMLASPDQRVTVSGLTGDLPFHWQVAKIDVADRGGAWLVLENAAVDVDALALLQGMARIETLSAAKIDVLRPPAPSTEPPPKPAAPSTGNPLELPSLPLGVQLEKLAVARIQLEPPVVGEPVGLALGGKATLVGGRAEAQIDIDRVDGQTGHVALRLDYAGPSRLGLELHFAEPSGALLARFLPQGGRRPLQLDLGGQGPISGWRGKIDFKAGDDVTLSADLALGRNVADTTVALKGQAALAGLLAPELRDPVGNATGFDLAAGIADAGPIGLDHLNLTLGAGTIQATGRFDPKGSAITARIEADVDPAPLQALAQANLGGHVHLVATAGGTVQAPSASVTVDGQKLVMNDLAIATLATKLDAVPLPDQRFHVTTDGKLDGLTSGGVAPPAGLNDSASWSIDLAATRDGSKIEVKQAKISGGGVDVDASGTVEGQKLAGHVRLAAQDLKAFAGMAGTALEGRMQIDADATSPDGQSAEIKLTGKLDNFRSGIAQADALLGRSVTLAADAKRSGDQKLDLSSLKLGGADLTVTGNGSLDPKGQALQGHVVADIASLEPLGPSIGAKLGGKVSLTADAKGTLKDPGAEISLVATDLVEDATKLDRLAVTASVPSLAAKQAKVTVKLAADKTEASLAATVAQPDPNTIKLDGLKIDGPSTTLTGSLALDLRSKLVAGGLDGKFDDLSAWGPLTGQHLAGQLSLSAKLTDKGGQGVDATVEGNKLGFGDGQSLQHIRLAAKLTDLLGVPRGTIDLDAAKLAAGAAAIDTLKLQAEAKRPGVFDFTAKTAGRAQDKPFTVALGGQAQLGRDQKLLLSSLDGKFADLPFKLDQTLTATRKGDGGALDNLALSLGGGKITGHVATDGKKASLALMGSKLPLGSFARLGGQPSIAGTLGFDVALDGPLAGPRGRVVVTIPDLQIAAESQPKVPPLALVTSAEIAPDTIAFKGRIDGVKAAAALGFSGAVPIAFTPGGGVALRQNGPLQGKLEGEGRLEALGELIPIGEDRAGGKITIDLSLGGTPASPQAGGHLLLQDGRYDNTVSGMTLRKMEVELDGDQQAFVLHRFEAGDGGEGKLAVEGKVDLAGAAGPSIDMTTTLTHFTAARTDEATATLEGKILINGSLAGPTVKADITMPKAEINIPDQMPSSVPQLDVRRIDSSKPAPPPKPAAPPAPAAVATLEIHFHDPGQTFVRGRGLTSEWRGDLDITGTSADPRIVGEFDNVNGTFDILGKSFVLEHGTLRFGGGPLPQLDILAQVQAADITAEILVQGSPTRPALTLTSVPTLPQDEVLSRIMFGSGVGQITPAQGLQLAQAAATLAGGGPSMLDRLRNATGLDRLSVGSDPTQTGSGVTGTTISGGKYVAPGVFVGVDQGVSGTSTKAKVEIEITPNITANATAAAGAEGSSVGVQYKLDY